MTIDPQTVLVHLRIVGVVMACLVVVNVCVPLRFHWREELARLSLVNRQIFEAHTVFLVLTLALLSALLLTCGDALLEPTRLSRAMLTGLTIFWTLRMLMQWGFFSPKLWRGHRFNTAMHCVFSAIWVYVSCVFAAALWTIRGLRRHPREFTVAGRRSPIPRRSRASAHRCSAGRSLAPTRSANEN